MGSSKSPKCHIGHSNFYKALKSFCDLALKYRIFWPPAVQNCGKFPNVMVSLGGCRNQNFVRRITCHMGCRTELNGTVRCGHFPLNAYLHKINKSETNHEQDDDSPIETINHFIFDCPAHDEARDTLVPKIGRSRFHLPDIMADANRMKALVTYINSKGVQGSKKRPGVDFF